MKPFPVIVAAIIAFIAGLSLAPAKTATKTVEVIKEVPVEKVVEKTVNVPGPERVVTVEVPAAPQAAECADGNCPQAATEPEYYVPQRRGLFRWRR